VLAFGAHSASTMVGGRIWFVIVSEDTAMVGETQGR
jgi:hypothetical protein